MQVYLRRQLESSDLFYLKKRQMCVHAFAFSGFIARTVTDAQQQLHLVKICFIKM